jgi:hypothetical protein
MINRGLKQVIKEALFQGFFWIVSLILVILIAIKFFIYVKG